MIQFRVNFFTQNSMKHYRLITYSREAYRGDWQNYVHLHPYTEIIFITEGRGWFQTSKKKVKVQRGSLIIVTPNSPHTEISSEKHQMSYACFQVENLTFLFDSSKKDPSMPDLSIKIDDPEEESLNVQNRAQQIFFFDFSAYFDELFDLLRAMETEKHEQKPFWELAFLLEFDKLILFILRHTMLISLPHESDLAPNVMNNIHLYLQSQYTENITLDKLAEGFFLNKYYLSHAFKKKYKISPMLYLNKCRCEAAHKLLLTTTLSITDIATSVGFNSVVHFSNTYKKFYNASPTQTRRSHTNNTEQPQIDDDY